MRLSAGDIAVIALTAALMVVIGYILFLLSAVLFLPGAKFIIMAAFLSFMISIVVMKVRKRGTIFIFSLVFGGLMGMITVVMTLAIALSGLLTELTALIVPGAYWQKKKVIIVSSFFPFYSFIIALFATNYLTGSKLFAVGGVIPFLIVAVINYGLGFLGAKAAEHIMYKRLKKVKIGGESNEKL